MRNTRFLLLILTLTLLSPSLARPHGDLHEQIENLSRQINQNPSNAQLYLHRAELHRAHQDWDAAQADYDRALELNPALPEIDLLRGSLFLEANWPISAQTALSRFLKNNPNHPQALTARARALAKRGHYLLAAQDFSSAIKHTPNPAPELFVERAETLTAAGPDHFPAALQGLEEGIRQLGPLVPLQLYAIDLEVKQKQFDAALARLSKLASQSPRQETWLARRGEILVAAGRYEEAHAAFRNALSAIDKLPRSRRLVPAMQQLKQRLQEAIAVLPQPNPPPAKSR